MNFLRFKTLCYIKYIISFFLIKIKISRTSRLFYSTGAALVRPTVYYKINKKIIQGVVKKFVSFVCIVPVRMTTDLKYWKVIFFKECIGIIADFCTHFS